MRCPETAAQSGQSTASRLPVEPPPRLRDQSKVDRLKERPARCSFIQTDWGYIWGYRSDARSTRLKDIKNLQLRSEFPSPPAILA
jgi:hypothetical protein